MKFPLRLSLFAIIMIISIALIGVRAEEGGDGGEDDDMLAVEPPSTTMGTDDGIAAGENYRMARKVKYNNSNGAAGEMNNRQFLWMGAIFGLVVGVFMMF